MEQQLIDKLSKYTVLYAEDEFGIRINLQELLGFLFKEVYTASNGKEALEIFKQKDPDLVITDIQMPEVSGIELIKSIRKINKEVSIIILSAHTNVEYMLDAIELSLIRYIIKPITEDKLTDALRLFISSLESDKTYQLDKNWSYDVRQNIIRYKDDVFELTKKEAMFLQIILKNSNLISYDEIEEKLWNGEFMSLNALRLFIKNLRKKLPSNMLKNIQGVGYKLSKK